MARINNIFSAPKGSVGTLTFSNWKTTNYVKSKIQSNKSNTPDQQIVRNKFSTVIELVKSIFPLVQEGFKLHTARMSAYNFCVGLFLKSGVVTPALQIDYTKVLISRGGSLMPPLNPHAIYDSGSVNFSWTDIDNAPNANPDDQTLIAVLNETRKEAIFNIGGSQRSSELEICILPSHWQTADNLHAYIAFSNSKNVSNSTYISLT